MSKSKSYSVAPVPAIKTVITLDSSEDDDNNNRVGKKRKKNSSSNNYADSSPAKIARSFAKDNGSECGDTNYKSTPLVNSEISEQQARDSVANVRVDDQCGSKIKKNPTELETRHPVEDDHRIYLLQFEVSY